MDNLDPSQMFISMIGTIIIVCLIGFGCLKGCEYSTMKSICASNPEICQQVVAEFNGK